MGTARYTSAGAGTQTAALVAGGNPGFLTNTEEFTGPQTTATASAATASILLNDVSLLASVSVDANSTIFVDLKQVLSATQTIKGSASTTAVNFHISGVDVA